MPKAVRQWWPSRRTDTLGWYLLVQAGIVILVFSSIRTKLPHYILPAFPCLALWLARETSHGMIPGRTVFKWAAAMACLALFTTVVAFSLVKPLFPSHELFEKLRPQLRPEMKFATVGFSEPSLVWEFRRVLTNKMEVLPPEKAAEFLKQPGPLLLIIPTALYTNGLAGSKGSVVTQLHSLNLVNTRTVELTAMVVPPSPLTGNLSANSSSAANRF